MNILGSTLKISKEHDIKKLPKIGFIIETKLNRDLFRRLLDGYFIHLEYVMVFGMNHAGLRGCFLHSLEFRRQGYEHLFFLFETHLDTKDTALIKEKIEYFKKDFEEYGLEDYVTFVPIHPHFQAWIRPKMKTFIEETHDYDLFGHNVNNITIDIEKMKKEVPDFKCFVEQVEAFIKKDKKEEQCV